MIQQDLLRCVPKCIATVAALTILVNPTGALAAGHKEAKLYWDELENAILHEKIGVDLPDHTTLLGKVRAVRSNSLELTVEKSSNSRLHRKGLTVIKRADLSRFVLYSRRSHDDNSDVSAAVKAGSAIGALVGGPLAAVAGGGRHEDRAYLVFFGSTLAGAALGAMISGQTDTEIIDVEIVPVQPPQPAEIQGPVAAQSATPQHAASSQRSADDGEVVLITKSGATLLRRGTKEQPPAPSSGDWPVVAARSSKDLQF